MIIDDSIGWGVDRGVVAEFLRSADDKVNISKVVSVLRLVAV